MTNPQKCIRRPGSLYSQCRCSDECNRIRRRNNKAANVGILTPNRSAEVWAIVDELIEDGWTEIAIAERLGLPRWTVHSAFKLRRRNGTHQWSHASQAIVLGGTPKEVRRATARFDATGARRRVQALACLGWSVEAIVKYVADDPDLPNVANSTLTRVRTGVYSLVTAEVDDLIRAVYERLAMQVRPAGPGATRARNLARKHGWLPPLAWDDCDLDNPAVAPDRTAVTVKTRNPRKVTDLDEVSVERAINGRLAYGSLSAAERNEAIRVLHGRRWSDGEIAAQLGTWSEVIQRVRKHRLGLPANDVAGENSGLRVRERDGAGRSALYGGVA